MDEKEDWTQDCVLALQPPMREKRAHSVDVDALIVQVEEVGASTFVCRRQQVILDASSIYPSHCLDM